MQLKHQGVLNATQVCILCFWAAKAGVAGLVAKLAKPPDYTQTGDFSRRFDQVTGVLDGRDEYRHISVPLVNRSDGVRSSMQLPVTDKTTVGDYA